MTETTENKTNNKKEKTEFVEGIVKIFKKQYYINTETGVGMSELYKAMLPVYRKLSNKYFIDGYSKEDMIQELYILSISGLKNYNPDKPVALSTFLYTHLQNKVISKFKSNVALRRLPHMKNEDGTFEKSNAIPFSVLVGPGDSGAEFNPDSMLVPDYTVNDFIGQPQAPLENSIELDNLLNKIDKRTRKMVELIYLKGYSASDLVTEMNSSYFEINRRLKKLKNNPYIKELLNGRVD